VIGDGQTFRRNLLNWYDRHRRDLPWRVAPGSPRAATPDPYHVLLSETMLQQTQVATVVPYFHRFVGRFPTVVDLAGADLQEVLRLWQGLGYYRRARNLHACAKAIVDEYGGIVPRDVETLLSLPGVGRYTAGAIASLAYNTRAPILDGNVMRVLCPNLREDRSCRGGFPIICGRGNGERVEFSAWANRERHQLEADEMRSKINPGAPFDYANASRVRFVCMHVG